MKTSESTPPDHSQRQRRWEEVMYVQPKETVDRSELSSLLSLIDYVRGRLCLAITQLPPECTDRRRLLELVQEESLLLMENARVVQQWKD